MLLLGLASIVVLGVTFDPAEKVDAEHQYLKIADTPDKKISVFIGAFGNTIPRQVKTGDVIFLSIMLVNKAHNGLPEGAKETMFNIVSCENQIYRTVVLSHRNSKNDPEVLTFPNMKPSSEAFGKALLEALKNAKVEHVVTDSLNAKLVDAACNYIASYSSSKVKKKPKAEAKPNPKLNW